MTKKVFALLQSRPEAIAVEDEYQAFLRLGKLKPEQVEQIDLLQLPHIDLDDYQAILMGGGPTNFAEPSGNKTPEQLAVEGYVISLVQEIIQQDKPFFGACLGVGALVTALGGQMSYQYGESVRAVDVKLEDAAKQDDLLKGMPISFRAFVGHKEGVQAAPSGAVVLAKSATCLQMLRIGDNVYATQFHPELDPDGLALRLRLYKDAGYAEPEEVEDLIAEARREDTPHAAVVLQNFIKRYSVVNNA